MKRFVTAIIVILLNAICLKAQKPQVAIFVYSDNNTPTTALRSQLTSSFLEGGNSEYGVVDRTDEILNQLKQEYQYVGSGLVNEDQLISIGEHLESSFICVVVITFYADHKQYFFDGKLLDVNTRQVIKNALYPKEGETVVNSLDPQTQMRVGKELAKQLNLYTKEQITAEHLRIKSLEDIENQQQADYERQTKKETKKQSIINLFKPYSSFTFELGGSSRGFETGITVDLKFISVGGGIYSGDNRQFPIYSTQDHFIIKEVSPYFYCGVNFKYFGFGIKPTFYLLNSSEYIKSGSYTTEYIYEKQRLDTIINAYSTALLGFTPVIKIHLPFADWERFSRSEKGSYGGLGISVGYAMIPKIAHNPGLDFTAGITIFW